LGGIFGACFLVWPLMRVWDMIRVVIDAVAGLKHAGVADPSLLATEISTFMLSLFWGVMISSLLFILAMYFLMPLIKKRRQLREMMKGV
jgi:hypothetical protein